jgi:hypothetical protein
VVIEHVFVTTLEAPDALRLASEFLTSGGFLVQGQPGFQLGGWTSLEVARGKSNAARARSIEDLPQRVKVEWDRGRVTVAAYIQAYQRAFLSVGSGVELPAHSPKVRLHAQLMTAIAQGLELLLAYQRPPYEARQPWAGVSMLIAADTRRRRRNTLITVVVLIAIFALLIGLAVFAAMQR